MGYSSSDMVNVLLYMGAVRGKHLMDMLIALEMDIIYLIRKQALAAVFSSLTSATSAAAVWCTTLSTAAHRPCLGGRRRSGPGGGGGMWARPQREEEVGLHRIPPRQAPPRQ